MRSMPPKAAIRTAFIVVVQRSAVVAAISSPSPA
jgi:hypothetical protein